MEIEMFEYSREVRQGVVIFHIQGDLNAMTAPALKGDFDGIVEGHGAKVIFDLGELATIDSSGVGAIVSLFKRLRTRGGDVKIARLVDQPKMIFSLLRLDKAFDVLPSVEEAIQRFKG